MSDEAGRAHPEDDADTDGAFRTSRRRMIAATAWTVPVILVAQATPAAASAPAVSFTGVGCTHSGGELNGTFHFTIRVIRAPGGADHITVLGVSVGPDAGNLTPQLFNRAFQPADQSDPIEFIVPFTRSIILHTTGVSGPSTVVQVTYRYGSSTSTTLTSGLLPTAPCGAPDDSGLS